MMKRIVICCDGSGQDSDGDTLQSPSNVCLLSRAIQPFATKTTGISGEPLEPGIAQIVYYQAGVGTSFGRINKFFGDATGEGLKQNIREAYGFVCHNWNEGDEIYLFGFSRGAYTARAIAGLISTFGLLTNRGMDGFWDLMQAYSHGKFRKEPERSDTIKELADQYERHTPDKPIPIKFVGVFDTVQSVGLPKVYIFNHYFGWLNWLIKSYDKQYNFEDTKLHPNIDFAYHALSLDEARAPFSPNLWKLESDNTNTKLKQVWFPGVHCSVGGGDTYRGLSSITLAWMVHNISKRTNLEYSQDYVMASFKTFEPTIKGKKFDERPSGWACTPWDPTYKGVYRLGGHKPRTPGQYHKLKEGETTNESIHHSVNVRKEKISYQPPDLSGLVAIKLGEIEKEFKEKLWQII